LGLEIDGLKHQNFGAVSYNLIVIFFADSPERSAISSLLLQ